MDRMDTARLSYHREGQAMRNINEKQVDAHPAPSMETGGDGRTKRTETDLREVMIDDLRIGETRRERYLPTMALCFVF